MNSCPERLEEPPNRNGYLVTQEKKGGKRARGVRSQVCDRGITFEETELSQPPRRPYRAAVEGGAVPQFVGDICI